MLLEGEFDAASLLDEMKALISDEEKLGVMSGKMRSLAVPQATDRITEIVLGLCNK